VLVMFPSHDPRVVMLRTDSGAVAGDVTGAVCCVQGIDNRRALSVGQAGDRVLSE